MKPCPHCGNNPVPHRTHKFYQSMDILMGPFRRRLLRTWLGRASDRLLDFLGLALLYTLKPIGLVKINKDINQIPYARAKTLWQEAINRNIPIEEIKPFGQSIDLYKAKLKNRNFYFTGLPRIESVSQSNLAWVDDKSLLKKKLLEHNLPTAAGDTFTSVYSALKAFDDLEKPLIVKPRAGSRGRHTTTLVNSKRELELAFRIAKKLCHWVIVEEHLFGDVQRGTIIGGKLIGVLGGSPPSVIGDGKHSLLDLVKIKNMMKDDKQKITQINLGFLQRQDLDINTILPMGQEVFLSEKIGVNYGGTSYDASDQTHPDTKQMLEEVARVLDVSIIGLDFIIPDITKSYKDQKMGIIEANGAPFIQLHYDPLYGQTIPVAKHVWDLVS